VKQKSFLFLKSLSTIFSMEKYPQTRLEKNVLKPISF